MGGALNVSYCTLINCSIANNTAYSNGGGGGVEISSGFSNFYNCSFYNNLADRGGAIRNHSTSGTTILKNCIFWGNISRLSDVDINNYWALSTTSVTNTLLQRSLSSYTSGFPNIATGNNLFAQDPKFVDAANNNLALQICSPAINAGSGNTATNANTNVTTTIITDINGATRVQNGIIDIGAYENGANSNSPICSGKTINLFSSGGTSYSWYGPNGFTSTLQNPSLGNTSSAANGIYTVSITNGSCSTVTTTATTNVTVNALPTPLASSNSPICTGNSLNLSASGGTSYIWSGPSNFSSTLQNPSISNVGASSSGIYFVIVANANGCVATATTNVTVNPLAIAGSNSPICEGNTLNLSASNGISYDWIGPNSFSSIDQNPSIPNSITSLSGIYTVSVTNNLGCIETSTVVVTVNSLPSIPTITPPANSIICSPNTLTLTATGCAGIVTWLNNATGTSLTISAVDTYSISANCTQNGCISEQSSTISGLEIKAKPNPPTIISPNSLVVCSPTTLTLTATGCAGIVTWLNNATGTSLTISAVGTYSISANCTQNGCISEQSSTISGLEIKAKPSPPTIIPPENLSVCSPNTLTLTATGCAGIVTWSNGATGTSLTITSIGTYSISANCTVNSCISEQSSTISGLEIKAKPSPPTIIPPENLSVCSPTTLTLTATGCAGIVAWSNNATGTILTISEVGTYSISANCTQNSCISEQSSTVSGLEINAKPNPPTIISPEILSVCSPNTLTLTATGCAGIVTWSNNSTGTILTISEVGTYSILANCIQNGCISEQSSVVSGLEIKAKPSPPTLISPNSLVVCSPNTLTLTATGCAGIVTWSNNATGTILTISEVGTYSISANCTQNSCISEQSSTVSGLEINAKPNPPTIISPEILSVCSPNTLTLTATGCAGIVTWSNNSTGTILTISSIGTYSISANCTETGTPADGCISEQSSTVSGLEIKAKPNSPTIILPEILSVCSPNTLTLTATGCAGIVTWSNNSTGTSLTISSIGTYTISANCSTNGCISEQSSEVSGLEIKAKPSPPTIISPYLLVVCSPNSLTLTATGCAGNVTWSNNSTGTSLTISSIGTYSISANCTETGTPADGCISEQSSTVSGLEIKAKPNSPTIISPEILSVCSPNTLTLTATGCAGIVTWSNNSTGTSLTISSIGTYTISANCSTNGCISEQSSEVSGLEIKVKPSPPTIISPNLLVVCSPNTLTLTATGCAGIVTWPNNATGTILTISEVGTYSISANCTQNSCISEQSSTVSGLEINAKPNPPTIISPENLSVCSPNTLTLTATGCAGIVTWSNNATGTILTISEVGTYSILANCIQNGCISEQSSVVSGLEIKAKPSPPTLISPNSLVVCSPNTLTLTATGCAGIVTWSNNATGKSLTISAVGTYAISANCTVNSCISEQSSTISGLEIKAKPNLIAESNSPICAGSILNLISSGGNTYSWAGPNGYSSTSQNLTFRNATSSLSGIYTITSIGTNGCSASISVAILVRATGRIYVNDNATGANNGKSWGDALTDLQAALDYPCSFDEIWVAGGIYKPSKDPLGNAFPENERWKTFYLQNGINLYGGFAGNETSLSQRTKSVIIANPSILSGDIGVFGNNADNVFHVLTSVNDDNTTLLDGFTITNGNANGYGEYQIVLENQTIYNHYGGGLCNNLSSPTIQNCTFYTNFSRSSGGGIYNENASPIIINCSFLNNTSDSGGGMYNTNSSPIVNNTIFSSNISLAGGAIYNVLSSNPFFTNCLFFANAANYVGGGIFNYLSSSTITNCTFFGNTAVNTGGGIYNIVNSNIIVKNSIFWKNEVNSNTNAIGVDIVNDAQGRSWVTYTSMQLPNNTTNYPVNGQIVGFQGDGVGNIYATDPLFTNDTDPDGNDNIFGTSDDGLALQSASPVINIGDPSINSPATDVTGFTRTLPFDLGAYEYSPCSVLLNLISTNDDYSTGTYQKLASSSAGKIIAINKITGTAKVTYKAKIIELNAGFKADSGTVFLAEVGGCN